MEVSREDLLKHKAALEAQLRWVNDLLDRPSPESSPATPAEYSDTDVPPAPKPSLSPAAGVSHTVSSQPATAPAATPQAAATPRTAAAGQSLTSPGLGTTPPPATPDTSPATFSAGQKIGCIAVGIGICLGIVFAIFVLPYLLY